ncbi:hypothetical protein LINPERPRIM_LOCUS5323 [Linum perenne]
MVRRPSHSRTFTFSLV